jgi:hypothetical protein
MATDAGATPSFVQWAVDGSRTIGDGDGDGVGLGVGWVLGAVGTKAFGSCGGSGRLSSRREPTNAVVVARASGAQAEDCSQAIRPSGRHRCRDGGDGSPEVVGHGRR